MNTQNVGEYDQTTSESHTTEQPTAPQGVMKTKTVTWYSENHKSKVTSFLFHKR